MLGVLLRLVRHVQAVWFFERTLFMRVHVYVALLALLSRVSPGVPGHPLAFALGALVLSETALLPLVRSETLSTRASLKNLFVQ